MTSVGAVEIVNAFTVDVEDWYQVLDFDATIPYESWADQPQRVLAANDVLLDLLDEHGVRGTFFVLAWNAERWPELVERIAARGHEIASHGYAHRLVYNQTADEFRADVRRSKEVLEAITRVPVLGYRAPSFSITRRSLWALDVLLEEGFTYDASVFPLRDVLYGVPGAERHPHVIRGSGSSRLVELPMTTARMWRWNLPLGGGGYFRIFPYAYLKWGMRRVNAREKKPAVFFIHPWEVDPDHPRHETAPHRAFSTHYVNLGRTLGRLRRLLSDFSFTTARDVLRAEGLPVEPERSGT